MEHDYSKIPTVQATSAFVAFFALLGGDPIPEDLRALLSESFVDVEKACRILDKYDATWSLVCPKRERFTLGKIVVEPKDISFAFSLTPPEGGESRKGYVIVRPSGETVILNYEDI